MQGTKSGTQTNLSNTRFVAIVFVQLALLLGVIFYCFPQSGDSNASSAKGKLLSSEANTVAIDKAAVYHLYDQAANTTAVDNVQASGIKGTGVIIDAWRANTDVNRRACQSAWLFDRAHEDFCKTLRRMIILAVRETGAMHERIAYVPAPAETRVSIGDEIIYARGIEGTGDDVIIMPTFVALLQKKSASLKDSQ